MSRKEPKRSDSVVSLPLSASVAQNKENFDQARKGGGDRSMSITLPKNIKIPHCIRQRYEQREIIPKQFGLRETAPKSAYFPPKSAKFSQPDFSVFTEDTGSFTPLAESTSLGARAASKASASGDSNPTIVRSSAFDSLLPKDEFEEESRWLKFQQRQKAFRCEAERIGELLRRATPNVEPPVARPLEETWTIPHPNASPSEPKRVKLLHQSVGDESTSVTAMRGVVGERSFEIDDIDEYLRSQEEKANRRTFEPNYRLTNATVDQRHAVIRYIIHLGTHNVFPSHLIYQAVRIFDDMLQAQPLTDCQLELVMLVSLWIAMKRSSTVDDTPSASEIATYAKQSQHTSEDIIDCEQRILTALQFNIDYPDPFSILCYCIVSQSRSELMPDREMELIYYSGSYMIDLCLLNEELIVESPVLLGSTAAELAMALILPFEDRIHKVNFEQWRSQYARQHLKAEDIYRVRNLLIRGITGSCYKGSKGHIVFKKYNRTVYGRVSETLANKILKLLPPG